MSEKALKWADMQDVADDTARVVLHGLAKRADDHGRVTITLLTLKMDHGLSVNDGYVALRWLMNLRLLHFRVVFAGVEITLLIPDEFGAGPVATGATQ